MGLLSGRITTWRLRRCPASVGVEGGEEAGMHAAQRVAALPMPRRLRILLVTAGAMGTTCLVGAAVAALTDPPPMWWLVAAVAAFVAVSRVVSLQLRLGSSVVAIDWAEAALVYGFVELDLPWVVLATLIGAVAVFGLRPDRIKASYNISAAVVATSLACIALALLSDTRPIP